MGGRAFNKLLVTVTLKCNKGLLQMENPLKPTSLGALPTQVLVYACNAHALHDILPHQHHHQEETHHHRHHHMNTQMVRQHHHVQMQHHQHLVVGGMVRPQYHCHVHRNILQHHHHHGATMQHHHHVKGGVLQLHHHDIHRGFMKHHHLHRAHTGIICNCRSLCASASQDNDDPTSKACVNVHGKGAQHREALAMRLHALLKADQDDHKASRDLEAIVNQITIYDDPEGLLMGAACLKLATIYASENSPNVLKGLSYALRAVKAYEPRGPCLKLATCLYMAALVYISMGDFEKALVQLEQSASVMKRIKVSPCDEYCVALKHEVQCVMGESCDQFCNAVNFEVQTLFGTAKAHLGMHAEAAAHYHKSIKIKRKLLQAASPGLGAFYLETAEALRGAKDHKAAKELCVKALKIFLKCYGRGSLEEAKVRSLLSKVLCDLGNYEDSLSESALAKSIWNHFGVLEEVISLNLSSDRLLVTLKRWNEAMLRLEEVMQASAPGSKSHTIALILAARVCVLSNNDASAADYCQRALDALEHHDACTQIAGNLVLLSVAYEEKKEFEQAALFCKKAKEMFDQCVGSHTLAAATAAELEGKTGCLLIHAGKTIEAIPHLECSLSRLQRIPGADLLYVHFYLGLAYPEVQRLEEALEHFEAAKLALSSSTDVDVTLAVSIYTNLAATYSALNRLNEAIECQKLAADLVKKNNVEDFTLEEVESRLESYIKEVEVRKQCDGKY